MVWPRSGRPAPRQRRAGADHIGNKYVVSYHHVALNGEPFEAVWAGQGTIAIRGGDGLGTIDTRSWTTHSIAPEAGAASPPSYPTAPTDRRRPLPLRLHADNRYAVDLAAGRVAGQPRVDAHLAVPSYTVLP